MDMTDKHAERIAQLLKLADRVDNLRSIQAG